MKTLLHCLLVSDNKPCHLLNDRTEVILRGSSINDKDSMKMINMDAGDKKLSLPWPH